ncbi:MAG: hypothetical protein HY741_23780 [Chloroflexi bacterium]|nr:hypothetical protein [Chloroflexota bacterium]
MSKRKKRQPIRGQSKWDHFARDLRAGGFSADTKIIQSPPGESKISAVFLEFIEPFKQYAETGPALEKLIVLGICAWNAALLSDAEQNKFVKEIMETLLGQAGEEWRSDLDYLLKSLLERKAQFFAGNRRFIVSYHLEPTRTGYQLSMVATAPEP